jgi:hypothetical protein
MKMLSVLNVRNKKPNSLVLSYRLSIFPIPVSSVEKEMKEFEINETHGNTPILFFGIIDSIVKFFTQIFKFIKI